jgi:MYXO-CTERM domain-containing protein
MNGHPYHARRLFLVAGMAALLAGPLGAQANTPAPGTTGTTDSSLTGMGGTSAGIMQDTTTTTVRTEDDKDFPWGLLGLLGLAGLLGRRKVETVHHDTTRTARPGDPNYRV